MSPASERWPLGESNPDALRHKILSLACLPISPSGLSREYYSTVHPFARATPQFPITRCQSIERLRIVHLIGSNAVPHSVAKPAVLVARSVHGRLSCSHVDQWLT